MNSRARIWMIVISSLILAGCAAPKPVGTNQLTQTERDFFSRANPSAAVVTELSKNSIDVTNNTFPAKNWTEIIGDDRTVQIFQTVGNTYPNASKAYQTAAIKYCTQRGLWPTRGFAVAPHTQRFTCQDPVSSALYYANETAKSCEAKLNQTTTAWSSQAAMESYRQMYYTFPSEQPHICSPRNVAFNGAPPPNFCATYTEILGLAPGATLTCSEFVSRYTSASQREPLARKNSQALAQTEPVSTEAVQCIRMGFKQNDQGFSSCQLQLKQLAMQQKQFESQQKIYQQQVQALQQQKNYNQAQALFDLSAQAFGMATGSNQNTVVVTPSPIPPIPIAPIRITPPSGNPYTCAYQGARLVCR